MAISRRKVNRTSKQQNKFVISADQLSETIEGIFEVYANSVTENIMKAVDETAEEICEMVKRNAPVRFGEYRDGWTWKTVFESPLEKRDAVFNETKWQFIHLLEFGHVRKGLNFIKEPFDRVPPKPHVMPAWEKGDKIFNKKVKEAIKDA